MLSCAIVIPSRLAAVRLPRKPLLEIDGVPMIVSVAKRAKQANIGKVIVSCCGGEIADAVKSHGINAVITDPDLPSGTDRVFAAIDKMEKVDVVINLQGDIPLVDPKVLPLLLDALEKNKDWSIATPVAKVQDADSPSKVKVAMSDNNRALYFSRSKIPYGSDFYFEHIGVYAYRYDDLKRFVSLEQSSLEKFEKLEQLRALDDGMIIGCVCVDKAPISVDTFEDYEAVLRYLKG